MQEADAEVVGGEAEVFWEEALVAVAGKVREAAERFLGVQEEVLVSETAPKIGAEGLCGMTVWCPVYGDLEDIGRYYGGLEFCRRTGWGELVQEIV